MAVGWTRDGAVQDQIDASIEDALKRAKINLTSGESAQFCKKCGSTIPEARRKAILGVQICVTCQSASESS